MLSYMVIYIIYCHRLPFYFVCGGAPHQIQPHFCLIPTKTPTKKFSMALWVATTMMEIAKSLVS